MSSSIINKSAPIAQISGELFNEWRDWVADEATIEEFTVPVFSPEEQTAVREFNAVLDSASRRTEQDLPYIADFIGISGW